MKVLEAAKQTEDLYTKVQRVEAVTEGLPALVTRYCTQVCPGARRWRLALLPVIPHVYVPCLLLLSDRVLFLSAEGRLKTLESIHQMEGTFASRLQETETQLAEARATVRANRLVLDELKQGLAANMEAMAGNIKEVRAEEWGAHMAPTTVISRVNRNFKIFPLSFLLLL